MPDLKKETVAEWLDPASLSGLSSDAQRVLELRALGAKSSLAKLAKMLDVAGAGDRMRGSLQYYGAGRTGRWAGRLAQPQNLPRPDKGTNVDRVLKTIRLDGSLPELLYDKPLRTISSCLRGCLVARAGHVLYSIDLSQIEARVMAWLAGQDDLLERFRRGIDPYPVAAASVGSGDRQLGKVMTLACQFGMGLDGVTFQKTAREQYGVELTLGEASAAVHAYRAANPAICRYWWDLGDAAKKALGGGRQRVGRHTEVWFSGRTFKIGKPNGEVLYWHAPKVVNDEFLFEGQEQKSGNWMTLRTYGGKFSENVTQSVARDVLANAMIGVEERLGLVPVMHAHDEAVYEVPEGYDTGAIKAVFDTPPAWALDLPIASEARIGRRYGK